MKMKTLIAAVAIASAGSVAYAQDVTTAAGDVVMIEKNQGAVAGSLASVGLPALLAIVVIAAASSGGGS